MAKQKKVDPTYKVPALPEDMDGLKEFALKAHAQLHERTKQRDNLAQESEKLGTELKALYFGTQSQREREAHDLNIRRQWQHTVSQIRQQIKRTIMEIPPTVDTSVFEADDWQRVDDVQALAQRLLDELQQLKNAKFITFEIVPERVS